MLGYVVRFALFDWRLDMVLTPNDVYLASGSLPADYAWLRFMARAIGGVAIGLMNEVLES